MSGPVCYRCMQLKVVEAGDLCRMCAEGWQSPYKAGPKAKTLDEWSLDELIATQESGDVPGQRSWQDNEFASADEPWRFVARAKPNHPGCP